MKINFSSSLIFFRPYFKISKIPLLTPLIRYQRSKTINTLVNSFFFSLLFAVCFRLICHIPPLAPGSAWSLSLISSVFVAQSSIPRLSSTICCITSPFACWPISSIPSFFRSFISFILCLAAVAVSQSVAARLHLPPSFLPSSFVSFLPLAGYFDLFSFILCTCTCLPRLTRLSLPFYGDSHPRPAQLIPLPLLLLWDEQPQVERD